MNHTFDPAFIEHLVQEVIKRLAEQGVVVGSSSDESVLSIDDKLVTLATLDRRLNGVKQLVVGKRAIVTPAVKDELNDRSIELVRK